MSNNTEGFISVEKSINSYSGDFAARITSNGPSFEGPAPGLLEITVYPEELVNQLSFYYKCDTILSPAIGEFEITAWKNDIDEVVGNLAITEKKPDYVLTEIPLSLIEIPDSLTIVFKAKTINDGVQYIGHVDFLIDNVLLDFTTSIADILRFMNDIRIYPNPVESALFLQIPEGITTGNLVFEIIGLNGKKITNINFNMQKKTT